MKSGLNLAATCGLILATLFNCATADAAAGDRDPSYGQFGRALLDAASPGVGVHLQPAKFIQQADGKTVIVGWTEFPVGTSQNFVVVRLNVDGSLDNSFDFDGVAIVDFAAVDFGVSVVEQSDNKLVVAGYSFGFAGCAAGPCMAIARLNSNGSPDASFGSGGKVVVTNAGTQGITTVDVAMQGTDIVIGGHRSGDFTFARLNSAGVFDAGFGVSVLDMGDAMPMTRMIAVSGNKFVAVGGSVSPPASRGIALVNSSGGFDTSFNATGKLTTPCIGNCQYLRVVQQQIDQKLVLVGFENGAPTGSPSLQQNTSFVERRNVDGSLDATFGTGGRITNVFAGLEPHPVAVGEVASGVAVDSVTGAITLVGRLTAQTYGLSATLPTTPITSVIRVAAARLTSTGAADTSFGSGGLRILPLASGPSGSGYGVTWFNVNLLADGRAMILGAASQQNSAGAVTARAITVARLSNGPGDPGVITTSGFSAPEEGGFATAVVSRTAGSAGAITVSYATASDTAIVGSDFVATNGSLTWANGDIRPKLIKVPLIRDSVVEPNDESFKIVLTTSTSGVDITNEGTITILRDDIARTNTITVLAPIEPLFETSGSVSVVVSRIGTDPISVNYTTAWDLPPGAAAQSPSDYGHVNGMLIWAAGDSAPKIITIPIVNDAVAESAEEVNLAFYFAGGSAAINNALSTITIHNGSPPVISIAPTATVSEGQPSVTVNVTRTGSATIGATVSYATSNGSATAGSDYSATSGTLTWAPGDADVKTIIIPLIADSTAESTENFTVTLSAPTHGPTIGVATSVVSITDDDSAPPSGGGGGGGGASTYNGLIVLLGLLGLSARNRRKLKI